MSIHVNQTEPPAAEQRNQTQRVGQPLATYARAHAHHAYLAAYGLTAATDVTHVTQEMATETCPEGNSRD